MTKIQPVIMCGGSGTRLWPISRETMPKQFQAFVGDRTLFQQTVMRVSGPDFLSAGFVAAERHRFTMLDQVDALGVPAGPIVLEPVSRNTAGVAIVASLMAKAAGTSLILLLPSDHVIRDAAGFQKAVTAASEAALAGQICLFGVTPDRPETGYGYIEMGEQSIGGDASPVRDVLRFVEKPNRVEAERLVADGRHLWNAGIFLFSPDTLLSEAAERRPELLASTRRALETARREGGIVTLDKKAFEKVESISIDHALLEGSSRTAVSPLTLEWSDLGAWDAIYAAHRPDEDGNVVLGRAVGIGTTNSYIRSERQLVTTLGLSNILVIASDDAILVADKSHAQDVKGALAVMRTKGFGEADSHAEVHRPWGCYKSITAGDRFQVKVITVKPGGNLSLQLHRHRAEHWVVVRGTAQITCDDRVFMLYENQSTYIPQGATHRLSNPGHIPLEMIEVQSGSYLGEDDIIRVEDIYGRVEAAE